MSPFICWANAFAGMPVKDINIKARVFRAEVASTRQEQTKGFMFRASISPDAAMLFIYDQDGVYPFWMKNVKFPLDIIWIDAAKKIVYIKEDFAPCSSGDCPVEYPADPARYVLEVMGGTARELGLKPGDRVDFD